MLSDVHDPVVESQNQTMVAAMVCVAWLRNRPCIERSIVTAESMGSHGSVLRLLKDARKTFSSMVCAKSCPISLRTTESIVVTVDRDEAQADAPRAVVVRSKASKNSVSVGARNGGFKAEQTHSLSCRTRWFPCCPIIIPLRIRRTPS